LRETAAIPTEFKRKEIVLLSDLYLHIYCSFSYTIFCPSEVIVIDEIGTEAECLAARTIAQRGVQLVATAHGASRVFMCACVLLRRRTGEGHGGAKLVPA
jgi:hypothetical protein